MKAKERFQVETVSAFLHLDGEFLYLGQARVFGSRSIATRVATARAASQPANAEQLHKQRRIHECLAIASASSFVVGMYMDAHVCTGRSSLVVRCGPGLVSREKNVIQFPMGFSNFLIGRMNGSTRGRDTPGSRTSVSPQLSSVSPQTPLLR